jgi:pimeloyl-ACP methyl ester carboxylesterase
VVPLPNAEYLDKHLPHSTLTVIDAGHFIWEEDADAYAAAVTAHWQAH